MRFRQLALPISIILGAISCRTSWGFQHAPMSMRGGWANRGDSDASYMFPARPQSFGAWKLDSVIDGTRKTIFVTLMDNGDAQTPEKSDKRLSGRWVLDEEGEFGLGLTSKSLFEDLRYVGPMTNSSFISGSVLEGQLDTEWVGKFTMSLMSDPFSVATSRSLGLLLEEQIAEKNARAPQFSYEEMGGSWLLSAFSKRPQLVRTPAGFGVPNVKVKVEKAPTVYQLELTPDGLFHTSRGIGTDNQMSGWWKILPGNKICLEVKREKSKGMGMTADIVYWGEVRDTRFGDEMAMQAIGTILYGTFEALPVGSFSMIRKSTQTPPTKA